MISVRGKTPSGGVVDRNQNFPTILGVAKNAEATQKEQLEWPSLGAC